MNSTSLVLVLILCTAHSQVQTAPSRNEEGARPAAPVDPLRSLIDGYQFTNEQRAALYALSKALIAIGPHKETNQEQIAVVEKSLLTIADDASRPSTDSIANLARFVSVAMINPRIQVKTKMQITRDLWLVLNMSQVNSMSLSATADLCNTLQDRGLSQWEVRRLRDTVNSIIQDHYKRERPR